MIKLTILTRGSLSWRLYLWIHSHDAIVAGVCKVIIRFGSKFLAVESSWWKYDKSWKDLAAGSISCRWGLNVWDRSNVLLLDHTLPLTLSLSLSFFLSRYISDLLFLPQSPSSSSSVHRCFCSLLPSHCWVYLSGRLRKIASPWGLECFVWMSCREQREQGHR